MVTDSCEIVRGPDAPPCPAWCTSHCGHRGWDSDAGSDATKTCRRVIRCADDADGYEVRFELRRFASVEAGAVVIDEPLIERLTGGALRPIAAMLIAETLHRVVEMVDEAAVA